MGRAHGHAATVGQRRGSARGRAEGVGRLLRGVQGPLRLEPVDERSACKDVLSACTTICSLPSCMTYFLARTSSARAHAVSRTRRFLELFQPSIARQSPYICSGCICDGCFLTAGSSGTNTHASGGICARDLISVAAMRESDRAQVFPSGLDLIRLSVSRERASPSSTLPLLYARERQRCDLFSSQQQRCHWQCQATPPWSSVGQSPILGLHLGAGPEPSLASVISASAY